jgi:F-box protein 11
MSEEAAAFLSYVHLDDKYENENLSNLCDRISGEVRLQTGDPFPIFRDHKDIAWGQQWKKRVKDSLESVTFLIPIVTPGFFKSKECRAEFELFLEREKQLGRDDLILPIYYVKAPLLEDEKVRDADSIAKIVASRQFADWRALRFEALTNPTVRQRLADMASQIVAALDRQALKPAPAAPPLPPAAVAPAEGAARQPASETQSAPGTSAYAAKTLPSVLVVDALHRGDHATIAAAIAAAEPGTVIRVRPGLYREQLVIDRPVEIIGDGEPGEVVIEGSAGNAIEFKSTMGRLANLTIRQAAAQNWFAVDIGQGRIDIEDCDITSQSLACVAIRDGADPRLRRNRVHDGVQCGIFVFENGLGTIEENEVFANAFAGVEIKAGANPMLRRNRIRDGKQSGVYIQDNGRGTLEDNEIFGNQLSNISIETGGNPIIRRNRIYQGKAGGVFIYNAGKGTIEDNEIIANAMAGIEIRSGADPALRRNRIHDGKAGGVFVHDNGKGTIEENEIFANGLAGVEIKTGGDPALRRNRIHDGKAGGVFVNERGKGTLEDNEIFANSLSGVEITEGGDPVLRRNRIFDGKEGGMLVHDNGLGTIEDNEIVGNAMMGIEVRSGGKSAVRNNRISKNGREAIHVHSGGLGTFEDNDLRDNAKGPWNIDAESEKLVVRGNNTE